jgi:LPS-assembly protein
MRDRPTVVGLRVGLLLAWLLVKPYSLALGESPGAGTPPAFHVTADAVESTVGGRFLFARGNVRIRQDRWSLYADEVEVDQKEETFTARGSVLFLERGNQIHGSSLRFNYGTGQGVIYEAQGFLLPSTSFSADELHREDERTYRLVNARYNSCAVCQPPPYAWEVRASEVTIHPEEYLWGTHGTFRVKGVPAMYLPIFRYPLADRQTGFLTPHFGSNSQEGFIYGQEFFWAISDSQDATLGLIYRSKRGVSPTVEYRYILENGRGSLNSQYLYDRELDEDRYVVNFRHQQTFTPALTGKADINVRSDRNFPEEFSVGFEERTNLINSSSAFLSYALPRHIVSLAGQFFQTRAPDASTMDEEFLRGPELAVTSFEQPLWDASPLLFRQESTFVYLDQVDEISAARVDLHPRLSLPIVLASYLTFTPSVAVRGTFYSRGAQDIEEDAVSRGLVELGTEFSSRLFRTFPVDGERLRGIRHTVEPRIAYLYIPEVTQDDLPQFDATDFVSPQNRFFFSLINRLSAVMREPDGRLHRFDFLTLTLETSVTPDARTRTFSDLYLDSLQPEDISQAVKGDPVAIPNRPGFSKATERDVANLVARMSVTPPWPVSLKVSGSLNPETGQIETGNGQVTASYKDIASFSLGYTLSRPSNEEAVIGQLGLSIIEGTKLTYLGRYDVEEDNFLEHQVGFIYQTCCWALNIIYTRRNTENPEDPPSDIRVNFELLTAPSRR